MGFLSFLRPGNFQLSSGSTNQHKGRHLLPLDALGEGTRVARRVACQLSRKGKPCFFFAFVVLCLCLWCKYCPRGCFQWDGMKHPLRSGEEVGRPRTRLPWAISGLGGVACARVCVCVTGGQGRAACTMSTVSASLGKPADTRLGGNWCCSQSPSKGFGFSGWLGSKLPEGPGVRRSACAQTR